MGGLFSSPRQNNLDAVIERMRRSAQEASERSEENHKQLLAVMERLASLQAHPNTALQAELKREQQNREELQKRLEECKRQPFPEHEMVPANLVVKVCPPELLPYTCGPGDLNVSLASKDKPNVEDWTLNTPHVTCWALHAFYFVTAPPAATFELTATMFGPCYMTGKRKAGNGRRAGLECRHSWLVRSREVQPCECYPRAQERKPR